MTLKELIKDLDAEKIIGETDIEIKNVKIDSKTVTKGSLFICLKGINSDGHEYYVEAEKYGAVAIITEKKLETSLTQIIVKSTRKALSLISAEFYSHPESKVRIIGITGTNGKTTTTFMLKSIFDYAKVKAGVIGTLGTFYADKFIEPTLTTPDPLILYKTLSDMVKSGVKVVIMEVSAHAIYLDKIEGIKFDVGIFSNLTQDHLDFFGNMQNYKKAKLKFFENYRCKYIVANSDDEMGITLLNTYKNVITYGLENPADVFAIDYKENLKNSKFVLNLFDAIYEVKLNVSGRFNVYNALAALTSSALLGLSTDDAVEGIKNFKSVEGRLEKIYEGEFSVYVDYAHTPDGLEKVLKSLKPLTEGRLICVFGCGGNRDKGKRKIMGKISGEVADFTIITTDNPRYEEPMEIIREIEEGVREKTKSYILIEDRVEGIKYAIQSAKEKDLILIAGKGAEKYQEVLGVKKPYSDKETVEEIMEKGID